MIESLSRYRETPEKIVIELGPDGYVLLGSDEAVAAADALEFLSAAIGREFRQTDKGVSMADLEKLGKEQSPPIRRTALQVAVDRLIREGQVVRTGRGVAHDPYIYTHPRSGGAESAETQSIYGRQTSQPTFALGEDVA